MYLTENVSETRVYLILMMFIYIRFAVYYWEFSKYDRRMYGAV